MTPEGRAWLARTLPTVIRETGFNAQQRAERILTQQGAAGLLAEISAIRSSYVRRLYFDVLFDHGTLDAAIVCRALRQAGREITSDYERATVLAKAASGHLPDETSRLAFVEVAAPIGSAYEKRRALTALLASGGLTPPVWRAALETIRAIPSDYEKSELIVQAAKLQVPAAVVGDALFGAVDSIGSDYARHHALTAILGESGLDTASVGRVIDTAARGKSDYELAGLLVEVLTHSPDAAAQPAFLRAAGTLHGDYERGRVLKAVCHTGKPSQSVFDGVVQASLAVTSDYERAELLVDVLTRAPDTAAQPGFIRAVDAFHADSERGRVLKAVCRTATPSRAALEGVVHASLAITSDYERANVLVAVAGRGPLDDHLRAAYRESALRIHSEYDQNQALAALSR